MELGGSTQTRDASWSIKLGTESLLLRTATVKSAARRRGDPVEKMDWIEISLQRLAEHNASGGIGLETVSEY